MRKVKTLIFLVVSVVIFLIGGAHGVTGANEIEEVILTVQGKGSLRNTKEAYRMALLKAMENARYKAGVLAEAEGLEVKQIKRVTEKQVYGPLYGAEGEGGEFTMAPFVPGQLKIEATVEVTFSLWRSS